MAWGLVINAQFPSNLQVVQTVASRQHDPCAQRQLLAGRKCADQTFQLSTFPLTQHHFRRGLGVAIVHSGQIRMLDLTRLSNESRLLSAYLY